MKDNSRAAAEDWICLTCNNLNYSFRKVCNRCKTTTRQDNHNYRQLQLYSIYYHSHYYPLQEPTPPPAQQTHLPRGPLPDAEVTEGLGDQRSVSRKWSEGGSTDSGRSSKWSQGADETMALVPFAWESLQMGEQPLSCDSESWSQNLSEDWQSDGMFLPNFDLTFL